MELIYCQSKISSIKFDHHFFSITLNSRKQKFEKSFKIAKISSMLLDSNYCAPIDV